MAIAVYGQLNRWLREFNLTIDELKLHIEGRYGLEVDTDALARLASPDPVRQVDMSLVAATAIVLGIGLGDLFSVEAIPVGAGPTSEERFLDEERTRRVSELFRLRDQRDLCEDEQRELWALIEEEGRRFGDYHLARYAARLGISIEEAQREADERLAQVAALEAWLNADPRNREQYLEDARRRKAAASR